MSSTNRNYRASFILDNRGKEETVEQIVDGVKKIIAEVQGEVTGFESIGKKDFARVTDKKVTGGHYVNVIFDAKPGIVAALNEKFKLAEEVYRVLFSEAAATPAK